MPICITLCFMSSPQIAVGPSVLDDPTASRDISFVNSISTSRGGTHVAYVADVVARAIQEHVMKVEKELKITTNMVRGEGRIMGMRVSCHDMRMLNTWLHHVISALGETTHVTTCERLHPQSNVRFTGSCV